VYKRQQLALIKEIIALIRVKVITPLLQRLIQA